MDSTEGTQESLTCNLCDREFKTKVRFKTHQKIHNEEVEKDKIYKCDLCDREFDKKMGLGVHKSKVHTIKTQHMINKKRKLQYDLLTSNTCNKCSFDGTNVDDLNLHLEVLHPIRSPPSKKEKSEVEELSKTKANEDKNSTDLNKTIMDLNKTLINPESV